MSFPNSKSDGGQIVFLKPFDIKNTSLTKRREKKAEKMKMEAEKRKKEAEKRKKEEVRKLAKQLPSDSISSGIKGTISLIKNPISDQTSDSE